MSLETRCSQLVLEHGLPKEETLAIIARALSDSLTLALKCRVVAVIDGETLHIFKEERSGEIREMRFHELRWDARRHFRGRLERELAREKARCDHEYLSNLRGTVIRGTVERFLEDGSLLVLFIIEELLSSREIYALCPPLSQSPRERGVLQRGETKSFFVTSVRLVNLQGIFRHEIRVSRTSPRLPELLLTKHSGLKGIRCTHRIAGKISRIDSGARIPREAVINVSKELGERIVVRWRSAKTQRAGKARNSRLPTWG